MAEEMMRVAMYYNNKEVRVEKMPRPIISRGELLVKARACGICGSDVMEWYRIKKAPRVLGHEMTGEIVEIGGGVKNYKVGERVFVSHHVPCNSCHYCQSGHHTACETLHTTNYYPGGFSEYIRVPRINVERGIYPLPDNISFEEGTFIEPLACVLRGQKWMGMKPGVSVLVLGSGISGLLHIQLAKLRGAGPVIATDINEYRLRKAWELGADVVVNGREDLPDVLRKFNEGRLADRVIVSTGVLSASQQALECVERGGVILYFAVPPPGNNLPIPINDFWRNEVTIMTSYGASPQDLEKSLKIIEEGKIKVKEMVTHRLPLEKTGLGFQLVAQAGESIKVIVEPWREEEKID